MMIGLAISPCNTALLAGGGYVFVNAEAAAIVARWTVQPNNARKAAVDAFWTAYKAAGLSGKFEALYVLAAHDAQAARQNWIADAYNLTPVNAPAFAIDRGYTGNGTTSYLDSGFNPTTAVAPKFTQNDAHLGVWSLTNLANAGATSPEVGSFGNSQLGRNGATETIVGRPNTSSGVQIAPAASFPGHVMWTRSAASIWEGYSAGVDVGGGTTASAALSNSAFRVCGAATTSFGVNEIAAAHWGSNLTAMEVSALYSALNTFLGGVITLDAFPENFYSGSGSYHLAIGDALEASAARGGRAVLSPGATYATTSPVPLTAGCQLYAPNSTIQNSAASGAAASGFVGGNLGDADQGALSYSLCNDITAGATSVTTTNAADAGGLVVGDYVVVRGGSSYMTGINTLREFGLLNRVTSANAATGAVGLAFAIDENVTSAEIGFVDPAQAAASYPSETLNVLENVSIQLGTFVGTSAAKLLREGGALIGAAIEVSSFSGDSFAYGNMMLNCSISAETVSVTRHIWETACYSRNVNVNIESALLTTSPSDTDKRPLRSSGNCRDIEVSIGVLDLDVFVANTSPIFMAEGRRIDININTVKYGNGIQSLLYFNNQNTSPDAQRTEDVTINVASYQGAVDFLRATNNGGLSNCHAFLNGVEVPP